MPSPSLPLELQQEIVSHIDDSSSLLSFCLTSRTWNMATTTSLYTSLTLTSFASLRSLARTLTTESGRVFLAPKIRTITLRLPAVVKDQYLAEAEEPLAMIFKSTPHLLHLRSPPYPSTPLRLSPFLISQLPSTIQTIDNLFPTYPTSVSSASAPLLSTSPTSSLIAASPDESPLFQHLTYHLPSLTHLALKAFTSPSLLSPPSNPNPTPTPPSPTAFPSLTHLQCSTSPSFLTYLSLLPPGALPKVKSVELEARYDVELVRPFLERYAGQLEWVGVAGMDPWREGLERCEWQREELGAVLGEGLEWYKGREERVGFERMRGRG